MSGQPYARSVGLTPGTTEEKSRHGIACSRSCAGGALGIGASCVASGEEDGHSGGGGGEAEAASQAPRSPRLVDGRFSAGRKRPYTAPHMLPCVPG